MYLDTASKDLHATRQKRLEEDSATFRTYIEDAFDVIKSSNGETRCKYVRVRTYTRVTDAVRAAFIRQEHRAVEDLQEQCAVRHDVLRSSVRKAEQDMAALRGQLRGNRQTVNDLLERLQLTQEVTHSSDTRLTEVERAVTALWDLVEDIRETLHVLSTRRETLALFPTPGERPGEVFRCIDGLHFVP